VVWICAGNIVGDTGMF